MSIVLNSDSFFNLEGLEHRQLFESGYVWEALKRLQEYMNDYDYPPLKGDGLVFNAPLPAAMVYIKGEIIPASACKIKLGDPAKGQFAVYKDNQLLPEAALIMAGVVIGGPKIALGSGVILESGAMLKEPSVIGDCSEVRQGAYIRGYCLAGRRTVIGHTTEVKHTIFMDDAKAGHFAYLGDSILGSRVNLGAGTKMANLRFTGGEVPVRTPDGIISSGLRKLGAVLGDDVQTGCNSVTNPGTLIGRGSMLLPNTTSPSGYHPPNSLIR